MRSLSWTVLVAAGVALAVPVELWAQGRGRGQQKQRQKNVQPVRLDRESERVFARENRDGEIVFVLRDPRTVPVRARQILPVRNFNNLVDDDVIVLRDRDGRIIVVDRDDVERRFAVNQRQGRGPAFCRSGAGHPVWGRQWCLEKGWGLGGRTVFFDGRDRVIFRSADQFLVARVRDDRSTIERIVDRILFWTD